MTNNSKIQTMLDTAKDIWETAHQAVETMKDGERKQIKKLAHEVATTLGKEVKKVLFFVDHFAHNTDVAYVARGKGGGLVKGTRPVKVVKIKKVKPVVSETSETDTTQS